MPGSKDDPVILDPFQEIRNVGWVNLRYVVYLPLELTPLFRLVTFAGTLDFTGFNPINPVPETLEEFKAVIDSTYLIAFHTAAFPMFCLGRFMIENPEIDPVFVSTEGSPEFDQSFSVPQPLSRSYVVSSPDQIFEASFIFPVIRAQLELP